MVIPMLSALLLPLLLTVQDPSPPDDFAEAARRGHVAREAFRRANGVLTGWWATRDPATGLYPRRTDQPVWAPGDNAADMYPFLVLSARFTSPGRIPELFDVLRQEIALTTRIGWLPDWYSISERRFQHPEPDVNRIVFGAVEYAKDGLNPLIELDGPEPWRHRMRQLLDGVFEIAPVASDFGPLPADGAEVNGELLQTLTRFHFLTGEEKYIEWAERIGDAYCLEVLPKGGGLPAHHWDFTNHRVTDDRFSLNDHGNEIVGGLAELFHAVTMLERPSAERYEAPLRRMFDILLDKARNEDGLWYTLLKPSTGEVLSDRTPDTWGYGLSACVTFGQATGDGRYVEAARRALRGVNQERYLEWGGADSFADSIEGALLLLNRLPEPEGFAWLEEILPRYWAKQKLTDEGGTGIVEGWYGDGNYARTALMVAFYYTQGASAHPWNELVQLGAVRDSDRLLLSVRSDEGWRGRVRLDHPRHRDHYRLPRSHPRLNEFPEWFTVEPGELYRVHVRSSLHDRNRDSEGRIVLGASLIEGPEFSVPAGEELHITVSPLGPPPYGQERAPTDPFEVLDETGGDDGLVDAVDLEGESYAGESYRWTGKGPIEWTARSVYGPLDSTVWLRWGSKRDLRRSVVAVAGREVVVEHGGYDGFVWIPLHVPASWWDGNDLPIRVTALPGEGAHAFLSAIRVRRLRGAPEESSGNLLLELEDLAGGWREQRNIGGHSGRGFRVSNATGIAANVLRGTFEAPAGRWLVWARGYEGDDQDRGFVLAVDDVLLEPTHRSYRGERFDWQLAGCVELSAGEHELEVRDVGPGFEVADAVRLTTDHAFDPGAAERVERALLSPLGDTDPVGRMIEACVSSAEDAHARIAERQGDHTTWEEERARLRERLLEALGLDPLPPRTPLNAEILGTIDRDGYTVERLVFESRPGFPVTANVYVPDGEGPFPAVLCPVGHWPLAKEQHVVQSRCTGLAKLGFLALVYDPFGQGERAVEGNGHHEYFRTILVGRNNMSWMVWDTMRALDYLLERDDVDGERIGCTGASGGGLNTLYAAAVDERIRVAAPVVYVTRLREFLETRIGHCPCSHVNGLASFMDMGDVVGLIAPRPVMLVTASQDGSFTPEGARAAAEQARTAFDVFGAADRLAVREFDTGHDYDQAMREAVYGWLDLHLRGRGDGGPVPEPTLDIAADPVELHCFPSGRVPDDAETVRSLAHALAIRVLEDAPRTPLEMMRRVEERIDPDLAAALDAPLDPGLVALWKRVRVDATHAPRGYETVEGIRFVVYERAGLDPRGPELVVLTEHASSSLVEAARTHASRVFTLDPRGVHGGRDGHLLTTDAHLLGDSLLAARAGGVEYVLGRLRYEREGERRIVLLAEGLRPSLISLYAIHGAKGLPFACDAAGFVGLPGSFLELFDGEGPPTDSTSWRLLECGDVSDLLELSLIPAVRMPSARTEEALADVLERLKRP